MFRINLNLDSTYLICNLKYTAKDWIIDKFKNVLLFELKELTPIKTTLLSQSSF